MENISRRAMAIGISSAVILVAIFAIGPAPTFAKETVKVVKNYDGVKYSYNKNGLIKIQKDSDGKTKYYYDKKKRIKSSKRYRKNVKGVWSKVKIQYKKGKISKVISKSDNTSSKYTYSCTYNKDGKITKIKWHEPAYSSSTKYYYDQSKKLIALKSTGEATKEISYDDKGFINNVGNQSFVNTYSGNLPVKIKTNEYGENNTYKIAYKTIKVKKGMVKKIKKQQFMLIYCDLIYDLKFETMNYI